MKILHIIEDYTLNSGGLRTVVKDLNGHLNHLNNIDSIILSSQKEESDNIYLVERAKKNLWLYSKEWVLVLENIVKNQHVDLIHIHGVWMYPQYITAKYALKNKIPFIISPHGMYEPWLWTKGRLKKKIYFKFLTKNLFSKASRIHAITSDEQSNLKKLFPNSNFVEIPNLIEFNKETNEREVHFKEKYILFLGRLHEKKGIELLINSFSKLKNDDLILKIAGGFNEYKLVLEELVIKLGLQRKVQFLGLVKGFEKKQLFRNAFVFVAPSYSEVVGMVNLEAALEQTPVITTFQTGLKKEWNDNGGFLINPNQEELTIILKKVLNWTKEERFENGKNLCAFVSENYSWSSRIIDWISTYQNILKEQK